MSHEVVQGFSVLNRGLLYTSLVLSPAHFLSGWSSHGTTNLGFLAYNWYNQFVWYFAIQDRQLHALSLLPVHFNMIYAFTYLAGAAAGNLPAGVLLALGSAGVMVLNTVAAWIAWRDCQTAGYGEYEFFFFGWRTLSPGWHKFTLVWQIFDTMLIFACVILALSIPMYMHTIRRELADKGGEHKPNSLLAGLKAISNYKYLAIPGSVLMLVFVWPLILWVELIIRRNDITSPTDWVSVWLFVAQVGLLVIPSFGGYLLRKPLGFLHREKSVAPAAQA
ncbi:uncharacterized protein F5Z01DRAFT_546384 [Emericellopsis atlantica]|uniref:Uncharacterized protein n=1 Tax=Emericellopsis atlantica TaxID=2614577 RepID=A0A9P8CQ42_9HYPO|nr:uncharacterized protein F5Z01DRAFT_546384 [Emericellopsis atlantica]KAG9255539.1 hypothetical protein F5Z01DRAFT_546384 [Emericellopsis atlantica]